MGNENIELAVEEVDGKIILKATKSDFRAKMAEILDLITTGQVDAVYLLQREKITHMVTLPETKKPEKLEAGKITL